MVFSNVIHDTAFTTPMAKQYFDGKCAPINLWGDSSLESTIKALIVPHANGEFVDVNYQRFQRANFKAFRVHCFNIFDFYGGEVEEVAKEFEKKYAFTRNDMVTVYFKGKIDCVLFENLETQTTVFLVKDLNITKLHLMESIITVFYPWFVKRGDFIPSADEVAVLKALSGGTDADYLSALNKLAEVYDFKRMFIEKNLANFETEHLESRLSEYKRQYERACDDYHSYMARLQEFIWKKNESLRELNSIRSSIENGVSSGEVMKYFIDNRNVDLVSYDDGQIVYDIKCALEYWDDHEAEGSINNYRSLLYRDCGADLTKDDMHRFLKAVFLDRSIKLRMIARYYISNALRAGCQSHVTWASSVEYLPNPHINDYSCLGDYPELINDCLSEGDYIGAIEQCSASAMSLTFTDSVVMEHFVYEIYKEYVSRTPRKFIELPDGTVVSVKESIEWLKKEETK